MRKCPYGSDPKVYRREFRTSDISLRFFLREEKLQIPEDQYGYQAVCGRRTLFPRISVGTVYPDSGKYRNRESDAFLTRWMNSVRADQLPDGAVPDVVPYIKAYQSVNKAMSGFDTSCGWGDAVIRVPLAVYQAYGDRRILEENYGAMTKWMDYIDGRAKNHHPKAYETWDEEQKARSRYLWNTDFHFGDWLVPSMVLGNPDGSAMINTAYATMGIVAPAYYAFSARSMKGNKRITGRNAGEGSGKYDRGSSTCKWRN